jgi:DNA-binding response OmpR family regulator
LADADCMIVDFNLPGLHGAHVIRALRGAGITCPAIIITGDASGRARKAADEIGVLLLEKPLVAEALAEQITAVLGASRSPQ